MSQTQDIKAKQTKDEGGNEDKPLDKNTKVEDGREELEKSESGYLGEEKLDIKNIKQTVGGTYNQQTASAALSQQQQPQKAPPQIAPYMGYYNGVMPPFYQSFPYSNVSNASYKYYGPKVSQTYSGNITNQIPQESHRISRQFNCNFRGSSHKHLPRTNCSLQQNSRNVCLASTGTSGPSASPFTGKYTTRATHVATTT